ncbi:hypothetical protein PybrP1_003292 [[Pythium] brassicae (nom. inval.)]|nr:hypothetical protein PybrP1_003292 [[Pythium] brassicae (nom. inval.)]
MTVAPLSSSWGTSPTSVARRSDRHKQSGMSTNQSSRDAIKLADYTTFRASPPVLRALYEFGFGPRGLSVLHCGPVSVLEEMAAMEQGINMTDFSRTNRLTPAPLATDIQAILAAMKALATFASAFYNSNTSAVVERASFLITEYARYGQLDSKTCKLHAKLGKFRGRILSGDLATASATRDEFARHDVHLMELYHAQQDRRVSAAFASVPRSPNVHA